VLGRGERTGAFFGRNWLRSLCWPSKQHIAGDYRQEHAALACYTVSLISYDLEANEQGKSVSVVLFALLLSF
jgi:hypothetical protein